MSDNSSSLMTDELKGIWEREEELLTAFKVLGSDSEPQSTSTLELARQTIASSPYKWRNAFNDAGEAQIRLQNETFREKSMEHLLCQFRAPIADEAIGTPATVSRDTFSQRFATYSRNLLDGLNWTNILVAGGSVLSCLLPEQIVDDTHADVDLFICTRDEEEATAIANHILEVITSNVAKYAEGRYRRVEMAKTPRTLTIRTPWLSFQIVTTLFSSPLEVLISFDVDCGCVGTLNGGKDAIVTERAQWSLSRRYNLWWMAMRPKLVSEHRYQSRLLKYSRRGFGVLIAEKVDWNKILPIGERNRERLSGLGKLVFLDRLATTGGFYRQEWKNQENDAVRHTYTAGIEECIHGGDSHCKDCHKKLSEADGDPDTRLNFVGPLLWRRNDTSYQDFEDGKQIRVLPGQVAVPEDFEYLVYTSSPSTPPDSQIGAEYHTTETLNTHSSHGQATGTSDKGETDETLEKTHWTFHAGTPALCDNEGINTPNCYCGQECALKAVKKRGPNLGRRFFCCKNSQNPHLTCQYFQWEGQELPYDKARAQRLKEKVNVAHIPEAIRALQLDTSKQLLAISSCFKSGRISQAHRTILKDLICQPKSEQNHSRVELERIFSSFAEHDDIDRLGELLTQFCISTTAM